MLTKLSIKNIALIDSAEIQFKEGLNVLSGETGAGKSVIIDSLNFVLGAKADKSLIRSGQSECVVKAQFNIEKSAEFIDVFNELDIEYDDTIIITRKFDIDGKGSVKINGESVSISMLKKLSSILLDVHGQSEHFYLLKQANQIKLIDRFGGEKLDEIKQKIAKNFADYKNILSSLNQLGGDQSQRLVRLDILNYQINEIENCDLKEDEEDKLIDIKNKLNFQEKIINALNYLKESIKDEMGVSDILTNSIKSINPICDISKEYSELLDRLNSVYSEIDDIGDTASDLLNNLDFCEYNIDQIESRLDLIKSIKKKYGQSYLEIQEFLSKAKIERDNLENFNERAEKLLKDKYNLQTILYNDYLILSNIRKDVSKVFAKNVLSELRELGMQNASFNIEFNDLIAFDDCKFDSANGIDNLEFKFSANLGEPLKSLSTVISGGEMSRFMLAIKAQTAKYNNINTFIFDEIDSGISGVVAKVVGEKFAKIAKDVQIIAISHLPQISVMADNNLLIKKSEIDNKTVTTVTSLSYDEKIIEIVRLIGGDMNSDSAKIHAQNMILTANEYKKQLI